MKKWRKRIKPKKISYYELMDLDISLSNYILPRLKAYKEKAYNSAPKGLTGEEWIKNIEKMIWSFEFLKYENGEGCNISLNSNNSYEEGIMLFVKYFRDLEYKGDKNEEI